MKSLLKAKHIVVLVFLFLCQSGHGGTLPPDQYEHADRYIGTLTRANESPQEAEAFLKFNPPLWPLSLFSDDVSIEATIRSNHSIIYSASFLAPHRVLAVRHGLQGLSADLPESPENAVSLQEKGSVLKVGELGNGRFSFCSGDFSFQGYYQPKVSFCGTRSLSISLRQWYYGLLLPMLGTALFGSLIGGMKAKGRGVSLACGAMRGASIGFMLLPLLLMMLLVAALLLSALVGGAAALFHFVGLF